MPYVSNDTLVTDKRTINDSDGWDSQSEWAAYQSVDGIVINNGVLELVDIPVIDSFEDEDYSEYSGELGSFSFSTDAATDGTVAGEVSSSSGVIAFSGSGLPDYPAPGDTFRFDWHPDTNNANSMFGPMFGGAGGNDFYFVRTRDNGDLLEFAKMVGGSETQIATQSGFNQAAWNGQFITWEVEWGVGGAFTISLLDPNNANAQIISFTANDSEYSTGGVFGITHTAWGQDASTVQFDYARIV